MFPTLWKREKGVAGGIDYDPVQAGVLCACSAVAWVYMVELDLLILYTFRRRTGLYFWSLLISSWGCSLHALAFILKFLCGTSWYIYIPFIEIGKHPNSFSIARNHAHSMSRMGRYGHGTSFRSLLTSASGRPKSKNVTARSLHHHLRRLRPASSDHYHDRRFELAEFGLLGA